MNRIRTALILAAALLVPAPALAQGFYIGGSAGQSTMDVDINLFEGDDIAGKVFAGYRFNDYIALEAFYADFGEATNPFLGIDATAYGAQAVAILPVVSRFELFWKLGVAFWDADFSDFVVPPDTSFSDDGWDVVYGGGLSIKLTEWLALRAEYEFYEFETEPGFDVDTQLLSAGLQFNF